MVTIPITTQGFTHIILGTFTHHHLTHFSSWFPASSHFQHLLSHSRLMFCKACGLGSNLAAVCTSFGAWPAFFREQGSHFTTLFDTGSHPAFLLGPPPLLGSQPPGFPSSFPSGPLLGFFPRRAQFFFPSALSTHAGLLQHRAGSYPPLFFCENPRPRGVLISGCAPLSHCLVVPTFS